MKSPLAKFRSIYRKFPWVEEFYIDIFVLHYVIILISTSGFGNHHPCFFVEIDNIIIDSRFRLMIQPLVREQYLRLEADIVRNGCHDPVKLWQGILVDGLNRIRICKSHKLSYQTEDLTFNDRNEVIAYIASIQLLRTDVPEETRRYLIGKRFYIC